MSRKRRVEPSIAHDAREGTPWGDTWFWNCGMPRCQEWTISSTLHASPRGVGMASTLERARVELARHTEEFHPARKRPAVLASAYRWMDAAWRCVRAVAHWYITSPVPPILGLFGLLGLLVLAVIGEAGL